MIYATAYDLHGDNPKVLVAAKKAGVLAQLISQTVLPIARTPMSDWLLEQAGVAPVYANYNALASSVPALRYGYTAFGRLLSEAVHPAGPASPTTGQLWPRAST